MEYPFRNYIYNENDKIRIFKNIIKFKLHTLIDETKPTIPTIKLPIEMLLYKNNCHVLHKHCTFSF